MTLIARLIYGNVPIYFGDLLLSTEGEPGRSVNIPAADDVNALLPGNKTRSISGISQKVNILSDRLIISWSGNFIHARAAIREIADLEPAGKLCLNNIHAVIENIPISEKQDICLIGTVCTPQAGSEAVLLEHFEHGAHTYVGADRHVTVSGTGERTFIPLIEELCRQAPPPTDLVERFHWAEKHGVTLAAHLVGNEFATGGNLSEWWGGGIEVATIQGSTFAKHGNILHTLWQRDGSNMRLAPVFVKYDYWGDALVIQKFEGDLLGQDAYDLSGKRATGVKSHSYRVYTPLLKSRWDYDISSFPRYDLNYEILNCFIDLDAHSVDGWTLTQTYFRLHPIVFKREKDHMYVMIERSFFRHLLDSTERPPS